MVSAPNIFIAFILRILGHFESFKQKKIGNFVLRQFINTKDMVMIIMWKAECKIGSGMICQLI